MALRCPECGADLVRNGSLKLVQEDDDPPDTTRVECPECQARPVFDDRCCTDDPPRTN